MAARNPKSRKPGRARPRQGRGGAGASRGVLAFLALVALAAVAVAVWLERKPAANPAPPTTQAKPSPRQPKPPVTKGRQGAPAEPDRRPAGPAQEAGAPRGQGSAGRIALVIDDLGRSVADIERLSTLGVPLSYSVLPFESHTPEVVAALEQRGAEVLCHLPMEPDGGANPGPGALTAGMPAAELTAAAGRALDAVTGAVGVNNHMGSRTSADPQAMRAILQVVAGRQLFFLDSRTSAASVGYRLAREMGLPAAERQVFLDPERREEAIRAQFERLLGLARERGAAIAIGHPYLETFAVLQAELPKARAAGFEVVPVSYLLESAGEPPL